MTSLIYRGVRHTKTRSVTQPSGRQKLIYRGVRHDGRLPSTAGSHVGGVAMCYRGVRYRLPLGAVEAQTLRGAAPDLRPASPVVGRLFRYYRARPGCAG